MCATGDEHFRANFHFRGHLFRGVIASLFYTFDRYGEDDCPGEESGGEALKLK